MCRCVGEYPDEWAGRQVVRLGYRLYPKMDGRYVGAGVGRLAWY